MLTVLDVIKKSADFLSLKGVESARLNAETIVGHVLQLNRMKLYLQFDRVLTEDQINAIRTHIMRRGKREPLQYIIGYVDFSGIRIKVDKRALIPRPETEYLIEKIKQKYIISKPNYILDLGTGSGVIALALANIYTEARILAVDKDEDALKLAKENVELLEYKERVNLLNSSWFESISKSENFDLIISNPPYLSNIQVEQADIEVKMYEPHNALISSDEGMADILDILSNAHKWMNKGGLLALETGESQHEEIIKIAFKYGYKNIESFSDLAGRERYILCNN